MRLLDIEYVRQVEISNVLNRERDDRCDYRLVAGHLDFPATFINTAANSRSPMMAIFENSGRILGKDFVTALFACRRFDVMKLVVEYYFKGNADTFKGISEFFRSSNLHIDVLKTGD